MKKCKECGFRFDPDEAEVEFNTYMANTYDLGSSGEYTEHFPHRNFCAQCAISIMENWMEVGAEEEEGGDWD